MTSAAPQRQPKSAWRNDVRRMLKTALKEAEEICHNEGGVLPSMAACEAAEKFIDHLAELSIDEPTDVYAAANGELVFSWRKNNQILDTWLMPDGQIKNFFNFACVLNSPSGGPSELDSVLKQFAA